MGANSVADRDNAVSVGSTSARRQITNVADGTQANDAVNYGQLNTGLSTTNARIDSANTAIAATNAELSTTNTTLAATNAGLSTAQANIATHTINIADINKQLGELSSGTLGIVQQNPASGAITVGASLGGSTVDFSGSGGLRKLTGVANGVADDDVVTMSQLRATGLIDYTGKEVGAVTYDTGLSFDSVTFAGSNGTVLHRVAAGEISEKSQDAVNGSQLYALQEKFGDLSGRVDDLSGRFDDLSDRLGDVEENPSAGRPGTGEGSTVVGEGADASGRNSSAIGNGSVASGDNSSAVGNGSVASGDNSSAIGQGSSASGKNSSAIGQGSVASGDNSSAIGQGSVASGSNSSAVGQGSVASGSNSSAIGNGSVASGNNSSAVGQGSVASGNNAVALGAGSVADRDNAVSVGSAGNERQITNVAAGTAPTDAVNLQQMNNAVSSARQDAMGGVAAAMAVAGLPQSTQPGRTFMAMGASTYGGEYGTAMGLSYMTRDGKWTVKAAVNTSSRGEVGGVIGGGFYW
ncbi:hypothetical protein WI95_17385 [Burkholderia contaminans]|nr:hypothetical protein WI95_17385 [Burkholderia contaminans]